jgi:hypothetical protein
MLLGVLFAILVTWTLAALLPLPQSPPVGLGPVPDPGPVPAWSIPTLIGEDARLLASRRVTSLGQRYSMWGFQLDNPDRTEVLVRHEFGIPALALRRYHFEQFPPASSPSRSRLSWLQRGVENPMAGASAPFGRDRLPLLPIWLGFVIDVGAFGVLAWIFILSLIGIRRRLRRRDNRCVACGYRLAGLDVCPECGARKQQ